MECIQKSIWFVCTGMPWSEDSVMRLAVVGAGIAGLAVQQGRDYRIDTGFIVYNPEHYLLLTRLFGELAVISQPTQMSFSVHNQATGLEYNATNLDTLFCPRSNLGSPRFLGMGCDLRRFYREAPAREFPARFLVQFMSNHQMLQMTGRPQWRVVRGGSSSYVRALRARWAVCERLNCAVRSIRRRPDGVELESAAGMEHFDQVVLACHSDQALALLTDADERERSILGDMHYQANHIVLHTDSSVLPVRRKAWAAWNAYLRRNPSESCTVSYCMNLLEGIESVEPFVVTLNRSGAINPQKVLRRIEYHHPIHTRALAFAHG